MHFKEKLNTANLLIPQSGTQKTQMVQISVKIINEPSSYANTNNETTLTQLARNPKFPLIPITSPLKTFVNPIFAMLLFFFQKQTRINPPNPKRLVSNCALRTQVNGIKKTKIVNPCFLLMGLKIKLIAPSPLKIKLSNWLSPLLGSHAG